MKKTKLTENIEEALEGKYLLVAYAECGQHMRFYADARFKIMTVTLTLTTLLLSVQGFLPDIGLILSLIGFGATIVLYSLEYRYNQAWVSLLNWAEHNVEEKLFGKGNGPLSSYRDLRKPWYVLRSKLATNALYFFLFSLWLGNIVYQTYQFIH